MCSKGGMSKRGTMAVLHQRLLDGLFDGSFEADSLETRVARCSLCVCKQTSHRSMCVCSGRESKRCDNKRWRSERERKRERESETERDSKSTHGKTAQENNSKKLIRSERKSQTDGAREGMSHADRKRQRDRGRDTQAFAQFTSGRVHRCASSCLVDIEKPIAKKLPGVDITDALASSSGIPLVWQEP